MTEETPVVLPDSPELWATLARPLPTWFTDARLGIFIHWGPYSVPARAEPSGALGAVPEDVWFTHNAYAEWYLNTIRIPGSPAAKHHAEVHGDAPCDDFLDAWTARDFDPAAWVRLFAAAGAEYVIPTSKHHAGVALWESPGTGARTPCTGARGATCWGDRPRSPGRGPALRRLLLRRAGQVDHRPPAADLVRRGAGPAAPRRGVQPVRVRARRRPGPPVRPQRALERHRVARQRQAEWSGLAAPPVRRLLRRRP